MSEHTTNLTKTFSGRFLERILTKKRWNLLMCDFLVKKLVRTEVTLHFASILWNWKFHQEHCLMKNYEADIC